MTELSAGYDDVRNPQEAEGPYPFTCSSCGGGVRWCERRTAETGEKCCRRCDCEASIRSWEALRR